MRLVAIINAVGQFQNEFSDFFVGWQKQVGLNARAPHVQVPLDYQLPATVYPAAACHGVPCTIHHIPTYPGTDSHGPLAPKEGAGT